MKPHPRIRKTVKWGGAAVTVLLVVVWIGSGAFHAIWQTSSWRFGATRGRLVIGHSSAPSPRAPGQPVSDLGSHPFSLQWRYVWGSAPAGWGLLAPVWVLVPAALLPTIAAWRLDALARRRARLNLCPKCNYDRTGLASGAVCPECGSAAP